MKKENRAIALVMAVIITAMAVAPCFGGGKKKLCFFVMVYDNSGSKQTSNITKAVEKALSASSDVISSEIVRSHPSLRKGNWSGNVYYISVTRNPYDPKNLAAYTTYTMKMDKLIKKGKKIIKSPLLRPKG